MQATWASKRAGYLLVQQHQAEEAIPLFQAAVRSDVKDAGTWEAMGAAYLSLDRFTAALKSFSRALELKPDLLYARIEASVPQVVAYKCPRARLCPPLRSLAQCGTIRLALGMHAESLQDFEAALKLDPTHPAALLGAAEALAMSAAGHARLGGQGTSTPCSGSVSKDWLHRPTYLSCSLPPPAALLQRQPQLNWRERQSMR